VKRRKGIGRDSLLAIAGMKHQNQRGVRKEPNCSDIIGVG
jgi:hypothetical protein